MTREELKRHCLKQIEGCEMWARYKGEEPHGKVYEEHKLILELLGQEPLEVGKLPPVTQEPKTGHWIYDRRREWDGEGVRVTTMTTFVYRVFFYKSKTREKRAKRTRVYAYTRIYAYSAGKN